MVKSINTNKIIDVLTKVKEAIEDYEECIDSEWGSCRNATELIKDGEMPDLYYEVIELLNNIKIK